jgi:hypothetical protein
MKEGAYQPLERLLVGGICVPVGFVWGLIQHSLLLSERPNGEYIIAGVSVLLGLITFVIAWSLVPRKVAKYIGAVCWAMAPFLFWLTFKVALT